MPDFWIVTYEHGSGPLSGKSGNKSFSSLVLAQEFVKANSDKWNSYSILEAHRDPSCTVDMYLMELANV